MMPVVGPISCEWIVLEDFAHQIYAIHAKTTMKAKFALITEHFYLPGDFLASFEICMIVLSCKQKSAYRHVYL